jgi:hypothetical protein
MDCEFGSGNAEVGKFKHSAKGIAHSGRTDVIRQMGELLVDSWKEQSFLLKCEALNN